MTRLAVFSTLIALGLAWGGPPKPGPDPSKYSRDYGIIETPEFKTGFPRLGKFEVLAAATGKPGSKGSYNCIAHAMRIYDRWVWPGTKVADFDKEYAKVGLRRAKGLDYRFDPKLEKVVLYANVKNGVIECTHGARQLADGTWTSKLGQGPLIRHATPDSVAGPSYGKPIHLYVKERKAPLIDMPSTGRTLAKK
jgi:type VI secretion system secreted protein VgrG